MSISVVLYEDRQELRDSLSQLIGGTDGFELVGAFPNCNTVEKDMEELNPDVILMDIDMPGVSGLEGLKIIRKTNSDVSILMLTVFDDNKNILEAIKAGANGYLLKKIPPAKLLEAIIDAHNGGAPMTPGIARQVLQIIATPKPNNNFNLSEREKEVLTYLVNGYSYKQLAAELFISIDTVRSHIKKIYEKLHVNSKGEAVAKAHKDHIL
jgi:DNA-binding NarL/FixJ family response regulator